MNKHKNDKEDILNAAKVVLTNRFILTRGMHRFYAKETFRLYHKKWKNGVLLVGVITLGVGILAATSLPGWFKIIGAVLILAGCYFIFMSFFGYLYGANAAYRNLEESLIVGRGNAIAHGQIIDKAAMTPKDLENYYNVLEHAGILPE